MIHLVLAHFPIALLMTGAALLLWALVTKHERIEAASMVMLTAGALMSVPTVGAGLWIAAAHETHPADSLDAHRLLGIATMVVGLLAALSHLLRRQVINADLVRNVLFIAAAVLAGSNGFVGGEMTHGQQSNAATGPKHGRRSHSGDDHGTGADDHSEHEGDNTHSHGRGHEH